MTVQEFRSAIQLVGLVKQAEEKKKENKINLLRTRLLPLIGMAVIAGMLTAKNKAFKSSGGGLPPASLGFAPIPNPNMAGALLPLAASQPDANFLLGPVIAPNVLHGVGAEGGAVPPTLFLTPESVAITSALLAERAAQGVPGALPLPPEAIAGAAADAAATPESALDAAAVNAANEVKDTWLPEGPIAAVAGLAGAAQPKLVSGPLGYIGDVIKAIGTPSPTRSQFMEAAQGPEARIITRDDKGKFDLHFKAPALLPEEEVAKRVGEIIKERPASRLQKAQDVINRLGANKYLSPVGSVFTGAADLLEVPKDTKFLASVPRRLAAGGTAAGLSLLAGELLERMLFR